MATYITLDKAVFELNDVDLSCWVNHVGLDVDTDMQDANTMCGRVKLPGIVEWTLNLTLYQSFEAGGTHETLKACMALPSVPFTLRATPAAVSVTNPSFEGSVIPVAYAPLTADAGALVTIDLAWSLTAPPTEVTTPAGELAESSAA